MFAIEKDYFELFPNSSLDILKMVRTRDFKTKKNEDNIVHSFDFSGFKRDELTIELDESIFENLSTHIILKWKTDNDMVLREMEGTIKIPIPKGVDYDKLSVEFKEGLLLLTFPYRKKINKRINIL
jgi:HSP20 family molecular chaperone IbpA